MQATVSIPQEEALNSVLLRQDALSFESNNSAYVLMYDENKELQHVPVELGISNDSYVEIIAGVKDGDEVYKVAKTDTSSGGLFSSLASMMGGDSSFGGGGFGGGSMPSGDFSFPGGGFGGGGMGGGSFGGGRRR